jgi:hypothetical protein
MAWKLMPIKLPPGVFRNGTHYESKGRWYNVNLIRWFQGVMRPIGGWIQGLDDSVLTGYGRSGISWKLNDGGRRLVIGTEQKLYGWNGGTLSDITPAAFTAGRVSTVQGFGYGSGPYGEEGYGDQRTTGTPLTATTWSMDLWGDNWVGCASHEGTIYEWGGAGGTPASAISNAPTALGVFVTPERIMVALAAGGNPRKVQWSDSEDNTQWTPAGTNQAGDQILTTQGHIVSGHRLAGGQNLILTTSDVWVMSYLGPPFIYGFDKQGTDCGVVGNLASVQFDGRLAWMGRNQFWVFDGQVRPIPSEVGDYVFGNLNQNAVEKVFTAHIPRFNEIWWFYPTGTDASAECSEYVIYNYRENTWSIGSLSRCGWVNDSGIWGSPFGIKSDGKVYEHENGWTDDGADRGDTVYAQSGPAEIGNGGQLLWVNQVIPDEDTQGEVRLKFYSRLSPNGDVTSHGPYTIGSDYVDVRLQGRMLSLRVEEVEAGDWRWGVPRLNAQAGSGR